MCRSSNKGRKSCRLFPNPCSLPFLNYCKGRLNLSKTLKNDTKMIISHDFQKNDSPP